MSYKRAAYRYAVGLWEQRKAEVKSVHADRDKIIADFAKMRH